MADVYGPGLNGVYTYTQFARKQLADSFDLTRQIGELDPNNSNDQIAINEMTSRVQEMRIALDYAADVLSLILKLTQPVQ